MAKKKQILYPVVFMVVITAVFTFSLALINELTIDQIQALEDTKQKQTILYVFGLNVPADQESINSEFNKYISSETINNQLVYKANKDNTKLGYAFEIAGPGLWGLVNGYAAINNDYTKILGIDFVSHSETPGLGGRISEPWFKEQFRGVPILPNNPEILTYRPAANGNVDAITGATQTSVLVRNFINEDITLFIKKMKGGI